MVNFSHLPDCQPVPCLVRCLHAIHPSQIIMQRPTSVTVFGTLNIAFSALGLVGVVATVAMYKMAGDTNNPVFKIMRDSPGYAAWIKLTIPLGLAACAVLLAGGIGLLMMKSWGRKLTLGYALYAMIFGLVGMVMNYLFLLRPLMAEAAQKQGPEAASAMGGVIGGTVGGCFGLIYPILLLIFMTRPKLVAAFNPSSVPPTVSSI